MKKFCSNCGKEVNENDNICNNCGVSLINNSEANNEFVHVPGKGLSIAGMVLGIISLFMAIIIIFL